MKPNEKAQQLFNQFLLYQPLLTNVFLNAEQRAKQCALIAVDEILKLEHPVVITYTETSNNLIEQFTQDHYWELVKKEIQNL